MTTEQIKKDHIDSVEFWLNRLDPPTRLKALHNFKTYPRATKIPFVYKNQYNNIGQAILYGFDWNKSPEGEWYWNTIYMQIVGGSYIRPEKYD